MPSAFCCYFPGVLYLCIMLHRFVRDISEFRLPDKFTYPFCYKPHPLVEEAAVQVRQYIENRVDWKDEIGQGKMFGVMVVGERDGGIGFIAAYSGNILGRNDHPYFVPPVYDLLGPCSFFRKGEAEISAINGKIASIETSGDYLSLRRSLVSAKEEAGNAVAEYKRHMALSKCRRDKMRANGILTDAMIRESQFEKAELKRIKKRWGEKYEEIERRLNELLSQINGLKEERKKRSAALQREMFDSFVVRNGRGEEISLTELFEAARNELPPAGAGECAAPKLLQYAYINGLKPLAMGEFWWGKSPSSVVRRHLQFYPACKTKCEPILKFMLQGLDVEDSPLAGNPEPILDTVYEDSWLWVVDKPAGMLSAPGKDGCRSVYDVARERFPEATGPLIVHRLDMHTSGLLVVAKTKEAHEDLQRQFLRREVQKEYIAVVKGGVFADKGRISLPLRLDYENRPVQVVDYESGKAAVTDYEVLCRYPDDSVRMKFMPLTGRTHQLRVHSSHPEGLDSPIKGDMLYGMCADRLYLHASRIVFRHPVTGTVIDLRSRPPF